MKNIIKLSFFTFVLVFLGLIIITILTRLEILDNIVCGLWAFVCPRIVIWCMDKSTLYHKKEK